MGPRRIVMLTLLACTLSHGTGLLAAPEAGLETVVVQAERDSAHHSAEGTVEAVRDTLMTAQVAGVIVSRSAEVGQRVRAGEELVRIDPRAAEDQAAASAAQVQAARAELQVALKEYERQRRLFEKAYISEAAFDRARAQRDAAQARVAALEAQAKAVHTQAGYHRVTAPYDGIVSEVPVVLGETALPGRPLVRLYDPGALRVTAVAAQGEAATLVAEGTVDVEIPGFPALHLPAERVQIFPAADPSTHTVQLRLPLPPEVRGLKPGLFARLSWRSPGAAAGQRFLVPASAVVRRAELTGLYVLDRDGKPLLRQVRLGRIEGERVEILSGVEEGERVVTNPELAARER